MRNRFMSLLICTLALAGSNASSQPNTSSQPENSAFTKITSGAIVNDGGFGFGCAWGDYDGDGFPDLFVCNWADPNGTAVPHDFLYHNRGDGTFERVMSGPMVNANHNATGAAWGDYDNDGKLDLFVTSVNADDNGLGFNALYHNEGGGRLTKVNAGNLVTQKLRSHSGIWGDFDNDGLLDIFVSNFGVSSSTAALGNLLFHNNGNGTFVGTSFGAKAAGNGDSWDVAAADFNNDGWLDFFVSQGGSLNKENGLLYTNNQKGAFVLLTNSVPFVNKEYSIGCAWGDYDNDGNLDLFVTRVLEGRNSLYHNNGNGTFTLVTNAVPVLDAANSTGCAWADYDNDGWLDLFVANLGPFDPATLKSINPESNFLYHNNGDGTFTRVKGESIVTDLGYSIGAAWADYDNDGFPDLFVSNGWITKSENNFLYHNNANGNNWITFKLAGRVSNQSAIGAKVRLRATIGGKTFWQMREISGGSGHGCQNDLRASFGLGNATNVDILRIEWPSGIVQTMTNVAAKQFLTIIEHQDGGGPAPEIKGLMRFKSGEINLEVEGSPGVHYVFEAATNLGDWSWIGVPTNSTGRFQFNEPAAVNYSKRFYRVVAP
jgi:hypothetical protein